MNGNILDDFKDVSSWQAITSGQAQLHLSQDRGRQGKAMRLDFDFRGGGGFVVARKLFALTLPESYVFSLHLRGDAPRNIFEFKLMGEADLNVWRYRQEAFDFPRDWQPLQMKSSQIEFAWGPAGGGPPQSAAAIELVIAAGPGGRGTVWIEELRFEDTTYRLMPLVRASTALPGYDAAHVCDPSSATSWRSEASDASPYVLIDFHQEREYGALVVHWEKALRPQEVELQLSRDGVAWHTVYAIQHGVGERTYVYLPHTVSRFVRLTLCPSRHGQGCGVIHLDVKPDEFSRSINTFFSSIAKETPQGLYPKYLVGQQTYWTPVGTGEDVTQALCNEEGMVEVDKGTFSIEPFLYVEGRLVTWADVSLTQELEQGYLPIPSAIWRTAGERVRITAFAAGTPAGSVLYIRYRVENTAAAAKQLRLFAAIRPFQVTPTWQHWHAFGGVSPVRELTSRADGIWVNGTKRVISLTPPTHFGAASFAQGAITEYLQSGELPPHTEIRDDFGYASGALQYDLELAPGGAQEIFLAIPFGMCAIGDTPTDAFVGLTGEAQFDLAVRHWETTLGVADIRLPPEGQGVVETLKTAAAHILINRDGPALQPGPRRYSRSWIRDGALMGAALLRLGCNEAMRDFLQWYAGYQTADGNLPDCVDREGCEWLPEYDSWGEFIFAIMDTYRFSRDRAFLADMWPAVLKSVAYMENLRNQRLTAEYRTPEKRAYYGLLPESMSHEGYMAHPAHAYWDDFWALRGLKDAVTMAEILGHGEQAQRLRALREAFRDTLYASLHATVQDHQLDFLPGSVEFADFDPTASAIAVTLVDELHHLPRTVIEQTFDKYLAGFRQRARGAIPWNNYSAYEIRIIGALVRLGRRQDAQELLAFFLADRRILPWNQWPEISWHDPKGPSFIGDMPHSWISAEYILAIRSLFAYEREEDQALVLAAGIHTNWLSDTGAVVVEDLPTHYGKLHYTLHTAGPGTLRLSLSGDLALPSGGIVVHPPLPRPLVQVEVNGRQIETFDAESVTCDVCPAEIVMTY
jgi:hypothetical protein